MSQSREKAAWGQHKDEVKGQDVFSCMEKYLWVVPIDTLEFGLELKVGVPIQGIAV